MNESLIDAKIHVILGDTGYDTLMSLTWLGLSDP